MRRILARLFVTLFILVVSTPAAAALHEARTRHFIIYGDVGAEELRLFAERLERFDQAVRRVRGMKDPPLTDSNKLTIYVLPNTGAIERLVGDGIAGAYVARVSGSVAFVPWKAGSKLDPWDLDAQEVFFHEYAHHLQLQYSELALPPWVTEGFAEFLGASQSREDGTVVLGMPATSNAIGLRYYTDLHIKEMVGADPDISWIEFALTYARGWLLTHYLTFSPERKGQLDRYVAAIQQGAKPLAAAETAFGDLNRLHRELEKYRRQKTLPVLTIGGAQLSTGPIALRALSEGEARMMRVHLRSKRGATRKHGRDIASDAREIAPKYPNDPFAQEVLAQAEFDAKNYAQAEAAADQALARDPRRLNALILKGRARMELARAGKRPANWSEIRSWFLRANKLDPEAAEPLLRFYETYEYAGARPTKNAIDGLLYSLALAPQDSLLRLIVVRQVLTDDRLPEAKRYFAPFAFETHFDKEVRAAATRTMAAITSGKASEATTQLDRLRNLLEKDR